MSTEEIANGFKGNLDILTDNILYEGIKQMTELQLDCDGVFYDEIVPILMAYIPRMDQHNVFAFSGLVYCLARVKCDHEELWNLIEEKIVQGRMFRYMGVRDICAASLHMGLAGRLTGPVAEKFEQVLTKHQASLRDKDVNAVLEGFKTANRGSESFLSMLSQGEFREEIESMEDYEYENYILPSRSQI